MRCGQLLPHVDSARNRKISRAVCVVRCPPASGKDGRPELDSATYRAGPPGATRLVGAMMPVEREVADAVHA